MNLDKMFEARELIIAQTKNKGGSGVVTCPACGGRLHFTQANSNKHVHAKCETKDCLQWIE